MSHSPRFKGNKEVTRQITSRLDSDRGMKGARTREIETTRWPARSGWRGGNRDGETSEYSGTSSGNPLSALKYHIAGESCFCNVSDG